MTKKTDDMALSTLAMLIKAKRLANGVKLRVGLPIVTGGA